MEPSHAATFRAFLEAGDLTVLGLALAFAAGDFFGFATTFFSGALR